MSETPMMKLKKNENKNKNKNKNKGKIAEASSSSASIPTGPQEAGNTFADDFYLTAFHESGDDYDLQPCLPQEFIASSSSANDSLSSRSSSRRQSSKPKPPRRSMCPICFDRRPKTEFFRGGCGHSHCNNCVSKYVAINIQENIVPVKCPEPGCGSALDPRTCCEIVPQHVLDRWEVKHYETQIPEEQKFYCPFKDCSALMVDDGGEKVTSAECPSCRRLFCAQCEVAWHAGVDCSEFRRRGKGQEETERRGEKQVKKLAKAEKWRRCPGCKFYVEKSEGCLHISCRCGCEFCYSCGSTWSNTHYCQST